MLSIANITDVLRGNWHPYVQRSKVAGRIESVVVPLWTSAVGFAEPTSLLAVAGIRKRPPGIAPACALNTRYFNINFSNN